MNYFIGALVYIGAIVFLRMFMAFCTRDDREDEEE